MKLNADEKLDLNEILADLQNYRPRRKGWTWRSQPGTRQAGPFTYRQVAAPLTQSCPLPAAKYFGNIDPFFYVLLTIEIFC